LKKKHGVVAPARNEQLRTQLKPPEEGKDPKKFQRAAVVEAPRGREGKVNSGTEEKS